MASSRTRTKLVVTSRSWRILLFVLIRYYLYGERLEENQLRELKDANCFHDLIACSFEIIFWLLEQTGGNRPIKVRAQSSVLTLSQRCSVLLIRSCLTKVKGYPYTSATIELRLPSICQRTPGFVQDMCKPRIGFPSEKEKGDTFALKLSYKAKSANSGMSLLLYLLKSTFFVRKNLSYSCLKIPKFCLTNLSVHF